MEEDVEEKDMKPILIKDLGMMYATEKSKEKRHFGIFKCQYCGNEFKTCFTDVKRGQTRSCGCIKGKNYATHGLTHHRFYNTWVCMKNRCYKEYSKSYKNYGGRGIKVCEEWLDVTNFINWAEETYVEGYTLDRIDTNGNYEPKNCRWADAFVQNANRRVANNNTSGFIGVSWVKSYNKWVSTIAVNKKRINLGYFKDKMEAVRARDEYIIENNLPHKLSTDY